MLEPKLLHFFVEVADTASFTRAAERLNVTQSWLSRQIATLEQQIGFKLFERTSRSVALSARGEAFLEVARSAVHHVRGAQALAGKLGREESQLAIGVPTYALMAEPRLTLCDRYLKRYPKVRVETRIDGYSRLEAALVQGELDLAFAIKAPEIEESDDINFVTVAPGQLSLIVPREHPDAQLRSAPMASLAGRRVAAFSKHSNAALFSLIFAPAVEAGAEIVEYSDFSFHRNLAKHDEVTLMPDWQPLPTAGLRRVPLTGVDHPVDLVCARTRTRGVPALEAFWALAHEHAA